MLGRSISDPDGIEGPSGADSGLGLLDIDTLMRPEKRLIEVQAVHEATGQVFTGYEIHIGSTVGPDLARPFAQVDGRPEGAVSADGLVVGSYLHGMFRDDDFRAAWLAELGAEPSRFGYGEALERTLDALADHMESHLDVGGLLEVAR